MLMFWSISTVHEFLSKTSHCITAKLHLYSMSQKFPGIIEIVKVFETIGPVALVTVASRRLLCSCAQSAA